MEQSLRSSNVRMKPKERLKAGRTYTKRLLSIVSRLAIAAILLLGVSLQAEETPLKGQYTLVLLKETATMIRAVDGDTIRVEYGGKVETVKLIGIDSPESRLSKKAQTEALKTGENLLTIISMGIDAERFTKSLVKKGDIVTIEFDVQTRDASGRLLAYVYTPDGKMLNREIVKAGYAHIVTDSPNVKYQEKLFIAYADAREHKRGMWK